MKNHNSLGSASERRSKFFDALRANYTSEKDCFEYVERLSSYIDAQLDGQDYLVDFANIALHLDSCEICAESYARLYELEVALRTNQLPISPTLGEPDLSFLAETNGEQAPSLRALLNDAITVTAEAIHLELSQLLLSLLQPSEPLPLTRAADRDDRYGDVLLALDSATFPDAPLPLTVTAFRDNQNPELCLVEIIVTPEGKGWPNLGGYPVQINTGQNPRTVITDAWGIAAFADLPRELLAELTIEISTRP